MAIPLTYNLRSAKERWTSSVVAVLGIAGTVGVFVAMLALARGFKVTLTSSGLPQNAIVQRGGADTDMTSILTLDDIRVVEDLPQIARDGGRPLISPEVVVIASLPMQETGTDVNVQVRGVLPGVLDVRQNVKLVEGRFIQPGLAEAVVEEARGRYAGPTSGQRAHRGRHLDHRGRLRREGSCDSEVWAAPASSTATSGPRTSSSPRPYASGPWTTSRPSRRRSRETRG
jgi:putative ABC transport system permease protein